MTCIVGLEANGKVCIGGDSAGVAGYSVTIRSDEKVFRNGPFLFGFTSSFRMGQVLRYTFKPPRHLKTKTAMDFLVTDFVNGVRKAYKASGFTKKVHETEYSGTFLLGYHGLLYIIDADFQVGRSSTGYKAVGCGDDLALGAMYATDPMSKSMPPEKRVELALRAATHFSGGVRAPYTILSI